MKTLRILVLFALGAVCAATTVVPMSIEKLTAQSTHVLHARALDHHSAWNAERTRIFTYTRFQVLNTLKGSAPAVISVKQLGGHADGYNMKVAGVRYWQNGDEAVLFLQQQADSTFAVTGLMQGDFRLAPQASGQIVVTNGVADANELAADGTVQPYHGAKLTLNELQQRVLKAVGR